MCHATQTCRRECVVRDRYARVIDGWRVDVRPDGGDSEWSRDRRRPRRLLYGRLMESAGKVVDVDMVLENNKDLEGINRSTIVQENARKARLYGEETRDKLKSHRDISSFRKRSSKVSETTESIIQQTKKLIKTAIADRNTDLKKVKLSARVIVHSSKSTDSLLEPPLSHTANSIFSRTGDKRLFRNPFMTNHKLQRAPSRLKVMDSRQNNIQNRPSFSYSLSTTVTSAKQSEPVINSKAILFRKTKNKINNAPKAVKRSRDMPMSRSVDDPDSQSIIPTSSRPSLVGQARSNCTRPIDFGQSKKIIAKTIPSDEIIWIDQTHIKPDHKTTKDFVRHFSKTLTSQLNSGLGFMTLNGRQEGNYQNPITDKSKENRYGFDKMIS